MVDELILNRQY